MQLSRRENVERAIHSAKLSGGTLSPQFLCDANRYVDGSLSLDEMLQRALNRNRGSAGANNSAEHPCSQTP
ncbi:antitoxin VbhA family protein [uncultured Varibaculum sp.]|uniref:antitoxin VbhA family protein n=1 Tax=Varibaculum cambriense TaxID=184870 RepID=UPI0035A62125